MGISMAYYEKKQIKGKLFRQMLNIPYANIRTSKVYNVAFIVGIIYVCYIVVQSKGIPILNGKRFYVETGQFVYLLINAMTYILAWYCVGTYAGKRVKIAHTLIFIILVTGLLMTGNRTPILRILYASS